MKTLMKPFVLLSMMLGAAALSGCATTRGDAAYKSGDLDLAATIYETEAARGDADAALKLGDLYASYVVKAGSNPSSLHWYEQACDLGNAVGCHNAAEAYENARGVPKDLNKAFDFYTKAARKGHVQSQYSVAGMYANDRVSPRNAFAGYKWGLVARERAEARFDSNRDLVLADQDGYLQVLEKQLTPEEQRQAEIEANRWRPEE